MADFETENAAIKETLAQVQGEMNLFRGNMETIMEYLQTKRAITSANPATVVVTNVVMVTTTADGVATVETSVEIVVPTFVNQSLFTSASNKLAAACPWGMPRTSPLNFLMEALSSLIGLLLPLLLLGILLSRGMCPWFKLLIRLMLPTLRTPKVRSLLKLLTMKLSTKVRASIFIFLPRQLNL